MIGLDTNVLPRYLVQDDPVQSPRATEIITRQLTEEEPGFISLIAILEVVWVLRSLYRRSRQEVASDIRMILAAETGAQHSASSSTTNPTTFPAP